jgi:hypothetical protein
VAARKTANAAQLKVARPPMAAPAAIDTNHADLTASKRTSPSQTHSIRTATTRCLRRLCGSGGGTRRLIAVDQAVPCFLARARDSRFSGRPTGHSSRA